MYAQFGGYATRAETSSSPIYVSERVFFLKNRYGINYLSLIHTAHVIQASTITQQNTSGLLFGEITNQFKFDTIKYQISVCESPNLEEHILVPRTSPLFFFGGEGATAETHGKPRLGNESIPIWLSPCFLFSTFCLPSLPLLWFNPPYRNICYKFNRGMSFISVFYGYILLSKTYTVSLCRRAKCSKQKLCRLLTFAIWALSSGLISMVLMQEFSLYLKSRLEWMKLIIAFIFIATLAAAEKAWKFRPTGSW